MHAAPCLPEPLTSYYWHDEVLRSRSVGAVVLAGTLALALPPAWLRADWARQAMDLQLAPGDVQALSLGRTRSRWPDYRQAVQAVAEWARALGVPSVLVGSELALMACRGAHYHHDGGQYGGAASCCLFLSEDKGLDVHFADTGQRIALARGTVMVFDTGQPHGVIHRCSQHFDAADFAPQRDDLQVFLSWELPMANAKLAGALGVTFDTDPRGAQQLESAQVWRCGAPATVCPASGSWHADPPVGA